MHGTRLLPFLLLLAPAFTSAQEATRAFPKNYTVAFENDDVEVVRVHYGPHERVGVHDHSHHPTVYVYLKDAGPVRFTHFEEKPCSITRPPTGKGAFRVSPGRIERHTIENLGDTPSVALSPADVSGSASQAHLNDGSTRWLPAGQAFAVRAASDAPVHLLHIAPHCEANNAASPAPPVR